MHSKSESVQQPFCECALMMCTASRTELSIPMRKIYPFYEMLFLFAKIFFNIAVVQSVSAYTYVCTHLHCTYASSSTFDVLHGIIRCYVKLERNSAGIETATHEVWVGATPQQRSIQSGMFGMEKAFARSYRTNDTKKSETVSDVLA